MSLYNVSNLHIIRSVLRQWCWSGFLLNIVFNGALYLRSSPIYILQISLPRAHITIFRRAFSICVFLFLLDMCKYIKECTAWMVLKYIVVFYGALFLRSTPNLHFTNLMLSLHYSSTLPFSCGHSLSCSGGGPASRRRLTRCWSSWRRGTRGQALSPDPRRGSSNPNRRRFLRPNVGRSCNLLIEFRPRKLKTQR